LQEDAKRTRAEELAALQRKFDEETKARQAEDQRRKAAAAEVERKRLEQQEEQRRAAEAKQREARRAMHAATPPTCVIKPAMTDNDLAKCRGR
jgi:hypothetical protein